MPQPTDWTKLANTLPSDEYNLPMPLHVLLGEAIDVAKFHAKYWENVKGAGNKITRHGLESAKKQLPKETGDEITSLVNDSQKAHTAYLLLVNPKANVKDVER